MWRLALCFGNTFIEKEVRRTEHVTQERRSSSSNVNSQLPLEIKDHANQLYCGSVRCHTPIVPPLRCCTLLTVCEGSDEEAHRADNLHGSPYGIDIIGGRTVPSAAHHVLQPPSGVYRAHSIVCGAASPSKGSPHVSRPCCRCSLTLGGFTRGQLGGLYYAWPVDM